MSRTTFKYNMSVYYQSTIAYLVVFLIYILVRSFALQTEYEITRDPIIWYFAFILVIAIISLLFNLYRNRHLEISDESIKFISRRAEREIKFSEITRIRLFRERHSRPNNPFRVIALFVNNRRRPVVLNPNNYENQLDLIKLLREIKSRKSL